MAGRSHCARNLCNLLQCCDTHPFTTHSRSTRVQRQCLWGGVLGGLMQAAYESTQICGSDCKSRSKLSFKDVFKTYFHVAVMKNSISRIGGSLLQLQYKPSQDITVTTCRVEGERTFWIEAKANILQCPGTTCKIKTRVMKTKPFCEEVSWSPS